MIKVTINNKAIDIDPRLTIGKYQKVQKNPNFYTNTTNILSLYLDMEPKELKGLPVDEIKYVESVLTKHTEKTPTDKNIFTFVLNGVSYGLENDWSNMTWGQWTDLEIFSQKDKIDDNIHVLMALLYRPVIIQDGKTYKLEKFDTDKVMERAKLFLELPVEYWFGCASFFLLISTQFIKDMESSLRTKILVNKWMTPMRKILPKWLLPKVPQDFILSSLTNSQETI